jgi:hypothetical protein
MIIYLKKKSQKHTIRIGQTTVMIIFFIANPLLITEKFEDNSLTFRLFRLVQMHFNLAQQFETCYV